MTGSRLIGQIALREALPDGAVVVLGDAMQVPMIALHPRLRVSSAMPDAGLLPVEGGVIVREPVADPPAPPVCRVAVAPTLTEARALGRRVWGGSAFLASDADRIDGVGVEVPGAVQAAFQARLSELIGGDPLAVLNDQREIGGPGVLETGESVLWLDALHCLRGLAPGLARQVAWRGCADGADMARMRLTVPDGRIRLVFDRIRAAPRVEASTPAELRWVDDSTLEIETGRRESATADLVVRAGRARLLRVGLVIPAATLAGEWAASDPLEIYSDPIGMEDLA